MNLYPPPRLFRHNGFRKKLIPGWKGIQTSYPSFVSHAMTDHYCKNDFPPFMSLKNPVLDNLQVLHKVDEMYK